MRFLPNRKSLLMAHTPPPPLLWQAHLKQRELAAGCENRFLFSCTDLTRKLNVVYVEIKKVVNTVAGFQCQSVFQFSIHTHDVETITRADVLQQY
jgi:hypothetical protein